jgi:diguanylate cyclase (GGDEF)-like protein
VLSAFRAALMGFEREDWIEFRAASGDRRGQWFEIQQRCLRDADNRIAGTLAMVRCIEDRKALEDKLFAAEMTCPLTGLTNRKAFVAMLGHLIAGQVQGSLAIVSVDYLKAINLRHGQAAGDEVLVAFAEFLRAMMRSQDIVSRFGGQSLAVLFPGTAQDQAEALCGAMIATLARLGCAPPGAIPVTASAGVAPIGHSLDETIKHAELALFAARAKGRSRLERAPPIAESQFSRAA